MIAILIELIAYLEYIGVMQIQQLAEHVELFKTACFFAQHEKARMRGNAVWSQFKLFKSARLHAGVARCNWPSLPRKKDLIMSYKDQG